MSDLAQRYTRKPADADAIQVTDENMEEVAKWCGGDIRTQGKGKDAENPKKYIKVRVLRAMNDRQTMAMKSDWVVYFGAGYKVYTNRAFHRTFQKVGGPTAAQALKHIEDAVDKNVVAKVGDRKVHVTSVDDLMVHGDEAVLQELRTVNEIAEAQP